MNMHKFICLSTKRNIFLATEEEAIYIYETFLSMLLIVSYHLTASIYRSHGIP